LLPQIIKAEPGIAIKDEKIKDEVIHSDEAVKIEYLVKDELRQAEVSTKTEPSIGKLIKGKKLNFCFSADETPAPLKKARKVRSRAVKNFIKKMKEEV